MRFVFSLLAAVIAAACSTPSPSFSDAGQHYGLPVSKDGGGSADGGGAPDGGVTANDGGPASACLAGSDCTLAGKQAGICCNGTCVDPNGDPSNCGFCGDACGKGQSCVAGGCGFSSCVGAPANDPCPLADGGSGYCCGDACADPNSAFASDTENCGGCGAICPTGSTCQAGICALADGGPSPCVDGGCPSSYACYSLQGSFICLIAACPTGADHATCTRGVSPGTCCGGSCIDTSADNRNCGDCGAACATGQFCDNGTCEANTACTPATQMAACPLAASGIGACCGTACVDIQNDDTNCGLCGNACPTGSACVLGACAWPDGGTATCNPGNPQGCPAGLTCNGAGGCSPFSCDGGATSCIFGQGDYLGMCCNGVCVDPTQDPANCGTCGATCGSGLCAAPFLKNGTCVPEGKAGAGCAAEGGCPGSDVCVDGMCLPTDCSTATFCALARPDGGAAIGFCCGGLFSAPTCADLASDSQNCGGCGVTCPGSSTCVNGVCTGTPAGCGVGRDMAFCDLDAGQALVCCPGEGCVDSTSLHDCGACGNDCTQAGPGQVCLGGQTCGVTACAATMDGGETCPLGDGGNLGGCCSGRCVDLNSDNDNCGGCDSPCAGGTTCQGGSCQ